MTNFKLIIPDVHQNLDRLDEILATDDAKNAQEIIFLGDYFDSFNYDFLTRETCEFLNSHINDDRFTFLIGNHDAHYLYDINEYVCSGYTLEKETIIKDKLDPKFKEKVKMFKYEKIAGKHFLFSHAGIHPSHFTFSFNEKMKKDELGEYFEYLEDQIKICSDLGQYHNLLGAGWDRGGTQQRYGGVTWQDWRNLETIPGLNQVVGHTHVNIPQMYKSLDAEFGITIDLNLDTNLKYYGKLNIDTGEITW